ncbi:helix-turn-helix domain-containing protein [Pseudodesulfovibrio cashew]|nr:cupin domain-containing protein [Pseudodesulfovibrio cashew]
MSERDNSLGVRIRHRRIMKGMRLADLAEAAQCSESMLSKIEHGKANPSLKTLHRIAKALELSAAALFDQLDDSEVISRAGERPVQEFSNVRSGTDIVLEALAPHNPDSLLQANIHIVHPGGHTDGEYAHEGEDLGYVLEGELELTLDGEKYLLGPGDSFLFRSEREHGYRNPGTTVTRVIWINTPPSF